MERRTRRRSHDLSVEVRDEVSVCDYCAGAYDVSEAGLVRLADDEGRPSVRSLVDDDAIITF